MGSGTTRPDKATLSNVGISNIATLFIAGKQLTPRRYY